MGCGYAGISRSVKLTENQIGPLPLGTLTTPREPGPSTIRPMETLSPIQEPESLWNSSNFVPKTMTPDMLNDDPSPEKFGTHKHLIVKKKTDSNLSLLP